MRTFALCAIIAAFALPAAAQDTMPVSASTAPVIRAGPVPLRPQSEALASAQAARLASQAQQASLGADLCLDSYQGLAPEGLDARPLILFRCHGRDNQRVALVDGVLYIGGERAHHIEPMAAPAEGCTTWSAQSQHLRYEVAQCRHFGATEELVTRYDATEQAMLLQAVAEPGAPDGLRGAPLMVRRNDENPATPQWEYVASTRQVRLIGTTLCITPPSRDVSEGAPLYLDECAAPYTTDANDRRDGVRRSRVSFERFWR